MSDAGKPPALFRERALRHAQSPGDQLVLLKLDPPWMDHSYRTIVAFFCLVAAYALFGKIDEYASGPAIVAMEGQQEVTARVSGVVQTLMAKPGDRVTAGAELVRLNDAQERAELARLQREIDLLATEALRSPSHDVRAAMMPLQAAILVARERVEAMLIRAPEAGRVRDLRAREGQHINQGDVVATIAGPDASPVVTVLLPGHARPRISPSTEFRLELKGYPYAFVPLATESIGEQVMTANEARRFLGPEATESWNLDDSVILVRTRPRATTFAFDESEYQFYHGMTGRGEARLERSRVIVTLLPALRQLGGGDG